MWFINLLYEIGIPNLELPVSIHEDTQVCIKIAATEGCYSKKASLRVVHLQDKYLFRMSQEFRKAVVRFEQGLFVVRRLSVWWRHRAGTFDVHV